MRIGLCVLALLAIFALRLSYGLFLAPIQPMVDEIQTALIGLKVYATHTWPYYGNDLVDATPEHKTLLTQDPGALEGLAVGLPLRLWPNPVAPFVFLNLLSMAGLLFFAFYARKKVPGLPAWFVYGWTLLAPWSIHFSTSMMNTAITLPLACLFFVAWMESVPEFTLNWMPLSFANLAMGFCFAGWLQLHRTWVLLGPFLLFSAYSQLKKQKKWDGLLYFILGAIPMALLLIPTFFLDSYHMTRDVSSFNCEFNLLNVGRAFIILSQYLALACFELPRFIGIHTADRIQYLASNPPLWPGFILWYFGIAQVLFLLGFAFDQKNPNPGWKNIRLLTAATFFIVLGALIFTIKTPDPNTFYEMFPIVLLYSFHVWERWWKDRRGKLTLQIFCALALVFTVNYLLVRIPLKGSLYLMYQDKFTAAVDQKDPHLLGERRAGVLY